MSEDVRRMQRDLSMLSLLTLQPGEDGRVAPNKEFASELSTPYGSLQAQDISIRGGRIWLTADVMEESENATQKNPTLSEATSRVAPPSNVVSEEAELESLSAKNASDPIGLAYMWPHPPPIKTVAAEPNPSHSLSRDSSHPVSAAATPRDFPQPTWQAPQTWSTQSDGSVDSQYAVSEHGPAFLSRLVVRQYRDHVPRNLGRQTSLTVTEPLVAKANTESDMDPDLERSLTGFTDFITRRSHRGRMYSQYLDTEPQDWRLLTGVQPGHMARGRPLGSATMSPHSQTFLQHKVESIEGEELSCISPFPLRFTVATFGVCMGACSISFLWKLLSKVAVLPFVQPSPLVGEVLWLLASALLSVCVIVYVWKAWLWPESAKLEYQHPVRTNFFFCPFISGLFLVEGTPQRLLDHFHSATEAHPIALLLFMSPILYLDLQIFGEWMSRGFHRLSMVANPTTQISIIGNFVGAKVATMCGWHDTALFFFAVGSIHQITVFVTLYQRLEGNFLMPQDLHPIYFLFVAPPSAAAIGWAAIAGSMDRLAKCLFFVAMFMYFQMVRQYQLFKDLRFSLAWWAYTFPMNAAACASILYFVECGTTVAHFMAALLSSIATLCFLVVSVTTIIECVKGNVFIDDPVVAECFERQA